ncbi:MAG: hypothetical protein IPJ88_12215 [Myxococcales bacterium]|nr:MAG: hypothetical protein IPJ88_12215 [Myxococcales bacterium]
MDKYEQRFSRQSQFWTGPKLIALAVLVLGAALSVIVYAATVIPQIAG